MKDHGRHRDVVGFYCSRYWSCFVTIHVFLLTFFLLVVIVRYVFEFSITQSHTVILPRNREVNDGEESWSKVNWSLLYLKWKNLLDLDGEVTFKLKDPFYAKSQRNYLASRVKQAEMMEWRWKDPKCNWWKKQQQMAVHFWTNPQTNSNLFCDGRGRPAAWDITCRIEKRVDSSVCVDRYWTVVMGVTVWTELNWVGWSHDLFKGWKTNLNSETNFVTVSIASLILLF